MVGSRQARLARSPPAAGREGPRAGQRNEDNPERGVRRGLDAVRHETDDLLVRLSLKVPIDEVSIEVGAGLSEEVEGPRGLPAEAGPGNPEDATSPLKEPTSRGVRRPPRQKPRPRNEEAEGESSQGLLYRTRSRPRREAAKPGSKGPASRGARGPARQKLRPRNEGAESEGSRELP